MCKRTLFTHKGTPALAHFCVTVAHARHRGTRARARRRLRRATPRTASLAPRAHRAHRRRNSSRAPPRAPPRRNGEVCPSFRFPALPVVGRALHRLPRVESVSLRRGRGRRAGGRVFKRARRGDKQGARERVRIFLRTSTFARERGSPLLIWGVLRHRARRGVLFLYSSFDAIAWFSKSIDACVLTGACVVCFGARRRMRFIARERRV